MAVGLPMKTTYANGDVFSASDVNDITGTVNLVGQTNNFYAGKNKIINGNFGVWQRGTSFQPNLASQIYTADRWVYLCDDGTNIKTYSQQTFTPGTAPVSGYEGQYFFRVASTVASATETYSFLAQLIEDVRTFAGQTITISFWAKAAATTVMPSIAIRQSFGSGGSAAVDTTVTTNVSVTTSWQRFSYSVAVPSISGKTVGTSSFLRIGLFSPTRATYTLDYWGVQVEAGSTATAFQTATGTIQGELAACQRYYVRWGGDALYQQIGIGIGATGTIASMDVFCPVQMRVVPTAVDYSTLGIQDGTILTGSAVPSIVGIYSGTKTVGIDMTVASGVAVNRPYRCLTNNSTSAYLGLSAEL